ncbi:hypothetical protein I656_00904 [Geobacillus sp. WSUCF1]|nr:hypothetical protein I656_00904 [Geobacillus sp. WSUCF1]
MFLFIKNDLQSSVCLVIYIQRQIVMNLQNLLN